MGFAEMAKTIAAKWNKIDPDEKKTYESLAGEEKIRYKKKIAEWRQLVSHKNHQAATSKQHQQVHQAHRSTSLPLMPSITPSPGSLHSNLGASAVSPSGPGQHHVQIMQEQNQNYRRSSLPLIHSSTNLMQQQQMHQQHYYAEGDHVNEDMMVPHFAQSPSSRYHPHEHQDQQSCHQHYQHNNQHHYDEPQELQDPSMYYYNQNTMNHNMMMDEDYAKAAGMNSNLQSSSTGTQSYSRFSTAQTVDNTSSHNTSSGVASANATMATPSSSRGIQDNSMIMDHTEASNDSEFSTPKQVSSPGLEPPPPPQYYDQGSHHQQHHNLDLHQPHEQVQQPESSLYFGSQSNQSSTSYSYSFVEQHYNHNNNRSSSMSTSSAFDRVQPSVSTDDLDDRQNSYTESHGDGESLYDDNKNVHLQGQQGQCRSLSVFPEQSLSRLMMRQRRGVPVLPVQVTSGGSAAASVASERASHRKNEQLEEENLSSSQSNQARSPNNNTKGNDDAADDDEQDVLPLDILTKGIDNLADQMDQNSVRFLINIFHRQRQQQQQQQQRKQEHQRNIGSKDQQAVEDEKDRQQQEDEVTDNGDHCDSSTPDASACSSKEANASSFDDQDVDYKDKESKHDYNDTHADEEEEKEREEPDSSKWAVESQSE